MANTINNLLNITKGTNRIVRKAGSQMFNSSLSTASQIVGMYKDAGLKTFSLGKTVIVKSAKLAINNQKDLLKTTGNALKEVAQTIKGQKSESLSAGIKSKTAILKKEKELTIDDMLN